MQSFIPQVSIALSLLSFLITTLSLLRIIRINKTINQVAAERSNNKEIKKYNEDEIIKHLEYIVDEAANLYSITHLVPNNVSYINTKMEKEFISFLQDKVAERISPTLIDALGIIYNPSFVNKYIGEYIYFFTTNYVVNYNMKNDKKIKGME